MYLRVISLRFPIRMSFLLLMALSLSNEIFGQNLVPNPSFEDFDVCPAGLSGGPLNCPPWINPTSGTSDYFNACSNGDPDVPDNIFGFQDAHTGVAYGGGYYFTGGILFDYREYLQVQLTQPLVAGTTYNVSLWYSLADDFGCPSNQLGIYLSVVAPLEPGNVSVLNYTPQIQLASGLITNNTTWLQLSGCFVSAGGEEYITIGNYYTDAETMADPLCVNGGFTYLYIDDVEVVENGEPPGTIDVDLGPEVEACDNVVLDPGLGNVSYYWQDGSHDPTYTVTETGTYYLTVTSGCDFGVDSVDVTIIPSAPPVDLGPDQILLCIGEETELTLDPDFGIYTWQDNSMGPTYTITQPGIYAVTLDDGCSTSTDEVEVIESNPPEQISLGNDTTLCDGEELTISFNAFLGDFLWQDGSTNPEYDITMPGTYSVTLSNICGSVTDAIVVDYLDAPVIAFPEDIITACPGDIVLLEFDPDLGDYVWQDGSTGPEYEVTEEGAYSVSVMNMCGGDFTEVYVEFLQEPQFDLGDDIIICPSQLPILFDLSNVVELEDIIWQDGFDGVVYEVEQSGTYAVTVSNACFSVEDEIEVIVEDAAPQVVLPADATLCPGETLFLDVSNITGNYEWQDGSTNPSYEVTQSGTYAVTVSNICGSGADSVLVAYEPPIPALDLGADIGICPGEEVILQIDIPGVSYLWQDGSTGNSYTITTQDTLILTITNACEQVSDTLHALLDGTPPALDLQDSLALCQGSSLEIDAMVGGVSYNWNTGDSTQTIQVNIPGIYVLTVSNTCGIAADSVIVSDAGAAPTVELGNDIVLCPSESVSIDANASNGSILWHDGSTGNTFLAAGPQLVSIQVSNSCGIAFDTLNVTVLNPTPVVELGADTTLCPGEILLLDPSILNVDYLWHDGSMNSTYTINAPGIISLEIADACGMSQDTIEVDYYPDAPAFNLGPDASLCPGESITLTPGISGVTYLWQDGSTGSSLIATQPGLVYVTLESNCWQISDSLVIFEDTAGPMIELGSDTSVCEGESVLINAGILGVTYLWQDGSTGSSFLVTSTQQIILQVDNACGNDRDTILVSVEGNAPEVALGQDTVICEGSTLNLVPGVTGTATLLWQDGSSTPFLTIHLPGLYSLIASNLCGVSSDSILVTGLSAPLAFSLGEDTVICPGETVTLQAPVTSDALQWSDGSTNETLVASSGTTWLRVLNLCGFEQDTISISVNQDIPVTNLEPFYQICENESVTLDISQVFVAQYLWNTGDFTPVIQVTTPGEYIATITTDCESLETSAEIIVEDCSDPVHVFVPNVFSPNRDNVNDVLFVQTNFPERISDFRFTVFDRWGNLVFNSEDISTGWDGNFKEKALNPGVYVYMLRWSDLESSPAVFIEHGDITLIR